MRIILTIKAVLNYLKNHLIDLVWVKVLRFSDGTEMDTVPVGNNLYDIKLLSQAIADKGWACMCHTTRQDLSKEDVPTVFADILDKYNNCDSGTSPIIDLTSVSVPLLYDDGYYYFLDKNDYQTLKKSNNLDLSNAITVLDVTNYVRADKPAIQIVKGNNSYGIYSSKNGKQLFIFDLDWNYVSTTDILNAGSWVSEDIIKYFDGYFYILINDSKKLVRISESTGESETLANGFPPNPVYKGYFCSSMIKVNNYIFYTYCYKEPYYSAICRININDGTYTTYSTVGNDNNHSNYSCLMYENNTLYCFVNSGTTHYVFKSTDLGETFTSYTINGINNKGQAQSIQKIDNTYYLALNTGIYTSTDLKNFTLFINKGVALSRWKEFFCNENSDIIVITDLSAGNIFYCNYSYTGLVKTKYSETINGTTIYYYKFDDWKICIAGENGINDINLDTVYAYLGYLNYWRLDLTSGSETISLPRDKRLWSMMFVGDNFQDDNLPTGNYVLPISYIVKKYDDGNGNGYRLYNDNWIEFYGIHNFNSSEYSATISVTLPKTMRDNKYNISIDCGRNTDNACAMGYGTKNKTTTGFDVQILQIGSSDYCDYVLWSVKGHIANS